MGPGRLQGGTVVRVGTLSKTLGSLGGFVAASRDVVDLIVNRARSYIFSTAPTPADAAAALAALRILRSAEGAALMARLAALIDRVAEAGLAPPGPSEPHHPRRPRQRAGRAQRIGGAAPGRPVGAGHPPADGAGRHEPPAGHAVGCAQRRGCQPVASRAGRWRARAPHAGAGHRRPLTGVRPRRVVAVVGTGTDIGKTWVAARLLTDLRAAGLRVAARKPAQSFEPDDDPATPRCRRARRGQRRAGRGRSARRTAGTRWRWRRPWRPRRWAARRSPSTTSWRSCAGPSDAVVDVGLVETAGGVRSPLAADGDCLALCRRSLPTSWCWSPTRGWERSTRCGSPSTRSASAGRPRSPSC